MLNFSKKDRQDELLNLIHENQGIVIKICRIYTNTKEDYDDLYQEILIQSWQSYSKFKGNSKFSTWLYKVSLNTALTRKRKEGQLGQREDIDFISDKNVTSETNFEAQDYLEKAMSCLSDIEKAFLLLAIEGYSYEEIAEVMGMSINHVGVKINRLKNKLKEIVK